MCRLPSIKSSTDEVGAATELSKALQRINRKQTNRTSIAAALKCHWWVYAGLQIALTEECISSTVEMIYPTIGE
jgi:hypothetical protein